MNISEKTSAILALEQRCFSESWSTESIRSTLTSESCFHHLLEVDGEVVGYFVAGFAAGECELYRIATSPDVRRRGYGRELMRIFLQECISRGITRALLEVRKRNMGAIKLYEECGFSMIATRKGYYGDDDALIFVKQMAI